MAEWIVVLRNCSPLSNDEGTKLHSSLNCSSFLEASNSYSSFPSVSDVSEVSDTGNLLFMSSLNS